MVCIKEFLKKIFPLPVKTFMREINYLKVELKTNRKNIVKIHDILEISMKNQEIMLNLIKRQQDIIKEFQQRNHEISNKIVQNSNKSVRNTDEIIWAEIFNNTITNSIWLNNKSFSPGRWAVGYQYLYVVYRILNEVKPKKILELGLGQSTRLISQYAMSDSEVQHTIVEHDPEWISFFKSDFRLPSNSKILQLHRDYKVYREDDKVLSFVDFKKNLYDQKFDFISIDAPLGGNAVIYSRVDILDILPECLSESFIIVVDDFNRRGEKQMVKILEAVLSQNNIPFCKGIYSGAKDCLVISSLNLKFVCTM